jgi:hypothetical protein
MGNFITVAGDRIMDIHTPITHTTTPTIIGPTTITVRSVIIPGADIMTTKSTTKNTDGEDMGYRKGAESAYRMGEDRMEYGREVAHGTG